MAMSPFEIGWQCAAGESLPIPEGASRPREENANWNIAHEKPQGGSETLVFAQRICRKCRLCVSYLRRDRAPASSSRFRLPRVCS